MDPAADSLHETQTILEPDELLICDDLDTDGSPDAALPPFGLSVSYPVPGVCVVAAEGEIDGLTAPSFLDCLREQLVERPAHLVVDLEAVTYLESIGLSVLVECSQLLADVPGSVMHLAGTARRAVARPLEATGLTPIFRAHRTLAEALIQLTAGQSAQAQ